jgi:hypothetical protein
LLSQPSPGIVVVVVLETKLGDAGTSHWQGACDQQGKISPVHENLRTVENEIVSQTG